MRSKDCKAKTHHQLCSPVSLGASAINSQDTLHCGWPTTRLIKPGCELHDGTTQPFSSPACVFAHQSQPVTAPLCCGRKNFDSLLTDLSSDLHPFQQPCGRADHKASTAHFHQPHPHFSALPLRCQVGIIQLLPSECFIEGILPRDSRLHNEGTTVGLGPEDQVWTQVGHRNVGWKSEPLAEVHAHLPHPPTFRGPESGDDCRWLSFPY